MSARRVAVTGAGIVSPLGNTLADFHRALAEARPGIRRLPEEITQGSGVKVAATVDWSPAGLFTEAESANIDRVAQFAIAASSQAIAAARLDLAAANRERLGVYWGTGMGGAHTLEASFRRLYADRDWRARPLTVVMAMNNAAGSNVSVRHGLRGPFANYSTACSSSAMALGEAMLAILAGRADAIVAGGAERGGAVALEIGERLDPLQVFVGDADAEFFFDLEHEFDEAQRVDAERIERRVRVVPVGIDREFLGGELFDAGQRVHRARL